MIHFYLGTLKLPWLGNNEYHKCPIIYFVLLGIIYIMAYIYLYCYHLGPFSKEI